MAIEKYNFEQPWQWASATLSNHLLLWHQKDEFYVATLDCQRVGWSMNGFAMWIMFTVSKNLLKEVHHARTDNFLARPVLLPAGTEYLLNKQPWWTTGAGYCNGSFLHWVVFAWQSEEYRRYYTLPKTRTRGHNKYWPSRKSCYFFFPKVIQD